jgi:hypothetical protein
MDGWRERRSNRETVRQVGRRMDGWTDRKEEVWEYMIKTQK